MYDLFCSKHGGKFWIFDRMSTLIIQKIFWIEKSAEVGIPETPSPLELANIGNLDPPPPP